MVYCAIRCFGVSTLLEGVFVVLPVFKVYALSRYLHLIDPSQYMLRANLG